MTRSARTWRLPRRSNASSVASILASDFWRYWFGQTISNVGSAVTNFALPLLVVALTRSPLALGIVAAVQYIPPVLFGLHAGVVVDRVDRRRMMILVDLARAGLVGSIPLAYGAGILSMPLIGTVAFMTASLGVLFTAGRFAAVPALTGTDFAKANGRLTASYYAATIIGPALGGLGLLFVDVPALLLADAISFVLSAVTLWSLNVSFSAPSRARSSVRDEIMQGLKFVIGNRTLRLLAVLGAIVNIGLINVLGQIVLLATTRAGASDADVGFIFATGAVGAIAASLGAHRVSQRWPFHAVIVVAVLGIGAATTLLSLAPNVLALAILWAVVMGSLSLFNVSSMSVRQQVTPSDMLGRVITVGMVLSYSLGAAGAIGGGLAIDRIVDVSGAYLAIGLATIVVGLIFAIGLMRRDSTTGERSA